MPMELGTVGPLSVTCRLFATPFVLMLLLWFPLGCGPNHRDGDRHIRQEFGAASADGVSTDSHALLLQFTVGGGYSYARRQISVWADGRCRLSDTEDKPIGDFVTHLGPREMRSVLKEMNRLASSRLKPHYSATAGMEDAGRCWLKLRRHDGSFLTSDYPVADIPRIARALYNERPEGAPTGLVPELIALARQHPVHALDLAVKTDRPEYQSGDVMLLTLVLRNAGSESIAVASLDCSDIVDGSVSVQGNVWAHERDISSGSPLQYEAILSEVSFGNNQRRIPLPAKLPPRALEDLRHLHKLKPGETLVLPFPKPHRVDRVGCWQLLAEYRVLPRYEENAIESALGMRLITGDMFADTTVTVR